MKYHLFTFRASALRALLVTFALTVGGAAFAFDLEVLAAEVSMTSSTTITDCPPLESEVTHDAVCLVGESMFGSMGVDLAKSGVQLAAMKAGLTPFRGWSQNGAQLNAAWVNAAATQGLLVMIQESNGVFMVALIRFSP